SVPENTPWAALTSTYIYFTYGTTNGKLTSYHVYAAFRKNESWIKTKNENVLSHEQLHFDIAEAFSRKLYKKAAELKNEAGDIPKEAKALFKKVNDECDRVQQQYDDESAHGTKEKEQAAWKKKIEEMMS